jgi:hypothetical protein
LQKQCQSHSEPHLLHRVGWTKGLELVKVARRDGQGFDCATWLHKAREMPKDDFRLEVEKELTGQETESWEIIYFKLYKSQIPVIEQAIETAALMLGSEKLRGYCLEMICADYLAGASLDNGDQNCYYNPFHDSSSFFQASRRRHSCRASGLHECNPAKTFAAAATSPILRAALSRSLAKGWLEMSILRHPEQSSNSSQEVP